MSTNKPSTNFQKLADNIKQWGKELGFQKVGITNTDLSQYEPHFHNWLKNNYHGQMNFMNKHGSKRYRPNELLHNTQSIICVRMNYLPASHATNIPSDKAHISCYAVSNDYHTFIRKCLQQLADKIKENIGTFEYRAFSDSAPVLEKALAEKAGLGWIGKHTNLLSHKDGSWFFLGELYTNLSLPIDPPAKNHCGACAKCLEKCPTKALIAPYQLDAKRCIAYLTIELKEAIPEPLRPLIGNRIYGCDTCQSACPWNKSTNVTREEHFKPRTDFTSRELLELFAWDEKTFLQKTAGSVIRRIGYECWLRNIAVALGNAPFSSKILTALNQRLQHPSPLVREHVEWATRRQRTEDGLS